MAQMSSVREYRTSDWREFAVDWHGAPYPRLEPEEAEIRVVAGALSALAAAGILAHTGYDEELFQSHRRHMSLTMEIPWTGIGRRMQRLIYAINAIEQPSVMVAMGVFCGNTFFCNAGAAVGPGKCHTARRLVGIEILEREAERARRNVEKSDPSGSCEILAADGVRWLAENREPIDLLYIDADGSYYDIIAEASSGSLCPGSLVLAHNSVNLAEELAPYLEYVRDPAHSIASMNIVMDDQGLEVTRWRGTGRGEAVV